MSQIGALVAHPVGSLYLVVYRTIPSAGSSTVCSSASQTAPRSASVAWAAGSAVDGGVGCPSSGSDGEPQHASTSTTAPPTTRFIPWVASVSWPAAVAAWDRLLRTLDRARIVSVELR